MKSRTQSKFEKIFLPHLDSAYSLARWISNDRTFAEDIVQAAYVRAWEYFERYENRNSAAWLLTIVRNVAYTMLSKRNKENKLISFDELLHHGVTPPHAQSDADQAIGVWFDRRQTPEFLVEQNCDKVHISNAIQGLSTELREVIILRELEGYSYKEIAEITEVPKGTVMSRLSRARSQLARRLTSVFDKGSANSDIDSDSSRIKQ